MEMIKGSKMPEATVYGNIHVEFIAQLNDFYVFDAAGVLTEPLVAAGPAAAGKVTTGHKSHQPGYGCIQFLQSRLPVGTKYYQNWFGTNQPW